MDKTEGPPSGRIPVTQILDFLAEKDPPRPGSDPEVRRPLTVQQQEIIRGSYIRVLGHDRTGRLLGVENKDQDISAVVAINNALVLDPEDLKRRPDESEGDFARRIRAIAERGWHISMLDHGIVQEKVLDQGGYGFLVEYEGQDGVVTPYGYQLGFPSMPRHMKNLSVTTMPSIEMFELHEHDTMTIWRTGIVRAIEDVRHDFAQLGIPISSGLVGQVLQGLGAGVATKLVDAVAAQKMGKERVQCNIGEIVRVDHHEDVIAANERSMGSASNVFDVTRYHRMHVDALRDRLQKKVAEMCWRILSSTPQKIIERALSQKSPVIRKGWNVSMLQNAGEVLAYILSRRAIVNEDEVAV